MFEFTYLFVLTLASLPLVFTVLQRGSGNHVVFVHRLYRDSAYILAAVLGIVCLEAALGISLENYRFGELGYGHRFWLSIEYRFGIFLVILLVVGLFLAVNLQLLCRPFPLVPKSAPWIVGFAIASLIGYLATPLWIPLMRFLGSTTAGEADPVFSKDISFYLLALPLYDDILNIAIAILFLAIALWVVAGVSGRRGATALIHGLDQGGAFHRSDFVLLPQSRVARVNWLRQGMVLGALLCLAFGASRFLARYHLVVDGHSKVVAGASYVDVNFWIPAYDLVVVCRRRSPYSATLPSLGSQLS